MTHLTVEAAIALLKSFSCIQPKTVESEEQKAELRQAIKLITSLCESENLGICADSPQTGLSALLSYLEALGYQYPLDSSAFNERQGPVYIKFNTQKMSHYISDYEGTYRGVLISCQAEETHLAGTYGHFPLDLFV